ncbi:2OG-Fe(II) oxygenase [Novilysobacter defluvii]|uniref:Prolyl 4-hydroxylase alpha subunit Fe(2+) 2OG dioxygenase domain-containing protein n=1 Tax=Lysobacter defluvii IMMIB APB-9 = DSM 18482 TaxID=1385515 RepID=A0A0A0M6A0_9GAMM|nr:2OG-Fe(II) oxygenase [Lysobacter defluvii]KGO98610.1 hypothetical protein N791_01075 [Lysobacter defluvii IMMIB APB-9 = DSM 18482]
MDGSNDDFIQVTDGALDSSECRQLVDAFEASGAVAPGRVGGGVHVELKDSHDLTISGRPEWQQLEGMLNAAMLRGLVAYARRWPHVLIAPVMLQAPAADGQLERLTPERIAGMDDAALSALLRVVFRPGAINLQRYRAGQGGYPYWHCELYPRDAQAETLHRHLLWTVYLNEGFQAGETEFLYQRRKVAPRTGSLLIAPAAFTHTHRGNRPEGGDKYIATSWVMFQRAERLYANG